jgi:ubiquinone/menaquinone biosynthesis C-methylase UbiE
LSSNRKSCEKKKKSNIFDVIAPFYGLFYGYQRRHYNRIIDAVRQNFDVASYKTIVDIGCGTGALCGALLEEGLRVVGIDQAEKMLRVARRKTPDGSFIAGSVLEKLPFEDKSFDLSIASYVAHGLRAKERKKMYKEMARVTKERVIIYDYNEKTSPFTSLVERLEGGDYFQFIRFALQEMEECVSEMKMCFSDVEVINVSTRGAWYICKP